MHVGKNRVDLLRMDSIVEVLLKINWMIASDQIDEMSLQRRKCRFYREAIGPNFDVYTRTICETECRISAAVEACGCAPFFYQVGGSHCTCILYSTFDSYNISGNDIRQCNVDELICLSINDWTKAKCQCPEECESITFIIARAFEFDPLEAYDRRLAVTVELPKNRYRRGVVFSMDSLIGITFC